MGNEGVGGGGGGGCDLIIWHPDHLSGLFGLEGRIGNDENRFC